LIPCRYKKRRVINENFVVKSLVIRQDQTGTQLSPDAITRLGEMGRHVKRVSRLAKKIKDIKAAGPLKLLRETLSSALQIGRRVNL
jgi:predicted ATPase with chaperone activity